MKTMDKRAYIKPGLEVVRVKLHLGMMMSSTYNLLDNVETNVNPEEQLGLGGGDVVEELLGLNGGGILMGR